MRKNKFSPDEPLRSGSGRGLPGAARGAIRAATAAAVLAGGANGVRVASLACSVRSEHLIAQGDIVKEALSKMCLA